jgi:hypothetical protein
MHKQAIIKQRHEILRRYLQQYPHALFDLKIWQSWVQDYLTNPVDSLYTPAALDQKLKHIFVSHDPRLPSQKLADFYVNPLFRYYSQPEVTLPESYHQSVQALQQCFVSRFSEAVNSFADDIYQHSASYFSDLEAAELGEQTEAYKKITQFFNALNLYVQQDILRGSDVNRQSFLIQFWLAIGEQVLSLGDISSAMSIMAALNSTAIQKLLKARQGLSEAQHARLESLCSLLSLETLRHQQDQLLKSHKQPVPYLGIYRTRFDVEKTKKNHSALNTIIHTIEELQRQIVIKLDAPLPLLPFSLDVAVSERYAICTDQLEKIAKQSNQNSSACHQKLSQFKSERLRDFFILKLWDPNPDDYSSWVQQLNQCIVQKQSQDFIGSLLKKANIECHKPDLQSYFRETRQAYYYHLIHNNCLKTALGKQIIHRKNRGDSTAELLQRLDHDLYNHQSNAEKKHNLIKNLSNLGLSLSDHQLDQVITEAQEYRISHGIEKIEQALEELKELTQTHINTAQFKQQFDSYKTLLDRCHELDLDEQRALRLEWDTVISAGHFGTPGYNPFLRQLDRLLELRDLLLAYQSHDSPAVLRSQINTVLLGLKTSSITSYIKIRHGIQTWLNDTQVTSQQSRLSIWQWIRAFFHRFYGVGRVLYQARLRSKSYLIKISINHINQRVINELNPLDNTRRILIQEPMPLSEMLLKSTPADKDQLVNLAPKWASFYNQARQTCEQISNDFLLAKAIERDLRIDECFTKKHQKMMNASGLSQRFVFFRHWTQSVNTCGLAPKLPDGMSDDQYHLTREYFKKLAAAGS